MVTRGQLAEFVALPLRLHDQARYVPTLQPQIEGWYAGEHAQAGHGPVRMYLCRDAGGTVVGRTCLHHNAAFDDKLGADVQLFGLTEFADGCALAELVALVRREARAAGRTDLFGPAALLPNQTGGVITSGFGQRGFVDSPWNPDSYPGAYESMGFTRAFEGQTWLCGGFADLAPAETFVFDDVRIRQEGLAICRGNRRRLGAQLPVLRRMLNAAFAPLPYYTRIGAAELAEQTDGLAFLLDESLLLWLTRRGEPVAFVLVVPDVSEFVMARGGRLGLRDQLSCSRPVSGTTGTPCSSSRGRCRGRRDTATSRCCRGCCWRTSSGAVTARCARRSSGTRTRHLRRSSRGWAAGRCTAPPSTG